MNTKWFLKSKTILGALLATVVPIAALFGYELGTADAWMGDILTLVGALLALYGRAKAVHKLTL